MRSLILFLLAAFTTTPAFAASIDLSVEVPRLGVSEYHRPYVAVWIERADHSVAADLAVWYQQKAAKDNQSGKQEEGSKWLSELRQWWRRSGRERSFPIDGVSGATRPAGEHRLRFDDTKAPLAGLAPGEYTLRVEAAREVGGRELVDLPFSWPPAASTHLSAQGETELGAVRLDLEP
jgi:hypothetical protein